MPPANKYYPLFCPTRCGDMTLLNIDGAMSTIRTMNPVLITTLTTASYLLGYTAFSKSEKKLKPSLLVDVLAVRKSLDHTLVELNKAISLSGLTVLTLAYCPGFDIHSRDLVWHSMVLLWTHAVYSSFKFYGTNHIPHITTFPSAPVELLSDKAKTRAVAVKKFSVISGIW